jgi:hypothetical protein
MHLFWSKSLAENAASDATNQLPFSHSFLSFILSEIQIPSLSFRSDFDSLSPRISPSDYSLAPFLQMFPPFEYE